MDSEVVVAAVDLAESQMGEFQSAADGVDTDGVDADCVAAAVDSMDSGAITAPVSGAVMGGDADKDMGGRG